jgi:leucyl/phenylalanyl-tRNA--protein transferase
MPIVAFPDPRAAGPEGLVALGGDLHPESLLLAYRQGIFPWPVPGLPLAWFCPAERAILRFADLRRPRRLARLARQGRYRLTIDQGFDRVIDACANHHRARSGGTWITPALRRAYREFYASGHAHSVEAWEDDELVGGLYGVEVDGTFAGESMFFRRPNASKLALLHLVDHLQRRGLEWMDIQMMTPHMQVLGASVLPREAFLRLLAQTRARGLVLFPELAGRSGHHPGSPSG